jgi:hypothetical protein
MASERLGKYLIASTPIPNPIRGVWHPSCQVIWTDEDGSHWHKFQNPSTFDTEDEALIFGFTVARAWIAHKL